MPSQARSSGVKRRDCMLAAAAVLAPAPSLAAAIFTPHELAQQYRREVAQRLELPRDEARLYASITEMQLSDAGQRLLGPQYLLVIDRNPHVQAALLFWRLMPGSYQLVGASPVSTSSVPAGPLRSAEALFEWAGPAARPATCAGDWCAGGTRSDYEFASDAAEPGRGARRRLKVRAADPRAQLALGLPCSDDCILMPASLIAFVDEYGVLDAGGTRVQRHVLPCRGRRVLLVDSGRDERPAWSPAPAPAGSLRADAQAPAVGSGSTRVGKRPEQAQTRTGARQLL